MENFAKTLWGDTQGLVLPYVTMMLVVIVGISVLAVGAAHEPADSAQNGADALALAGAAELDRLPDAQVRAVRAITNLLTNTTLFGSEQKGVYRSLVLNFTPLPADDSRPMSNGALATDSIMRFVSVTVRPVALNTILPASFLGPMRSPRVRRRLRASTRSFVRSPQCTSAIPGRE